MKIKPATQEQATALRLALRSLRNARYCLMFAECPAATDAVRRALKSAEGAERHMLRRLQHRDPSTGEPLRVDTPGFRDAPRAPEITSGPRKNAYLDPLQARNLP